MENFSKQTADAMNQGEKDFHTALSCINDAITYGLKVVERPYIRDKLADMYVTRSKSRRRILVMLSKMLRAHSTITYCANDFN